MTNKHKIKGISTEEINYFRSSIISEDEETIDEPLAIGARLVEQLINETITITRLTPEQWDYIAYFFYKTVFIVWRAIRLKAKIPLSIFEIRKPKVNNDIIQDFVYEFFRHNFKQINFKEVISKVTINMNLYGEAYILVETDASFDGANKGSLIDLALSKGRRIVIEDDDYNKIQEINDKYNEDGNIPYDETRFVIKKSMPYSNDFGGIKRIRVIEPFEIISKNINDEIGYEEIEIPISKYIKQFYEDNIHKRNELGDKYNEWVEFQLVNIGYSRSYVRINIEAINSGEDNVCIPNDPDEDVYFVRIKDLDGKDTPLLAVLEDLIDFIKIRLKNRKRTDTVDKNLKIFSSSDATPEELDELTDEVVNTVQENDISVVTTNYDVNVNEVQFEVKSALDNDGMDDLKGNIASGLGVPLSIISADDSYSGNYINIQLLNSEMYSFTEMLIEQINNKIIEPIAIKKGFIEYSSIYPKPIAVDIGLYKGSVLVDDFLDKLSDLISDEMISPSVLLEKYFGIDYEDSLRQMARDNKIKEEILEQ